MDAVNWSFRNFEFRILYLCDLKRIDVGLCNQESAIGNLDLKLWEHLSSRDCYGVGFIETKKTFLLTKDSAKKMWP
jgi:hypothetical protein